MTAFQIADSIQSIGFLTYIRESGYTYPVIMASHLASIAVFGGLILATDLRLLGVAFTDVPVADVVRGLRPWKWLGFIIIVIMGCSSAFPKPTSITTIPISGARCYVSGFFSPCTPSFFTRSTRRLRN